MCTSSRIVCSHKDLDRWRAKTGAQLPDSALSPPPPTADVRWTARFSCGSERGCNRGGAAAGRRGDGDGGIRGGERGGIGSHNPPVLSLIPQALLQVQPRRPADTPVRFQLRCRAQPELPPSSRHSFPVDSVKTRCRDWMKTSGG